MRANKQFPVVVRDFFYSKEECFHIFDELKALRHLLADTGNNSALNESGVSKTKKHQLWMDGVYTNRSFSKCLNINRKLFDSSFAAELEKESIFWRNLRIANRDTTLINYYENDDFYDMHFDTAVITAITWLFDRPKKFTGGDLVFEDGRSVKMKYGRTVIFPSFLKHGVTPVKTDCIGHGRWAMTQFVIIG
jgi:hypothetical protein